MNPPRPTLSLQVLAAANDRLGDLLAHHRALWDEAVVVDTGAGEAAAAAAAAGARAVRHPWSDDFAAARNAGLAAATADWILVLDTDELIAPSDFAAVRAALAAGPRLWIMPTVNYYPDARHPEWRPVTGRYPREESGQDGYFLAHRAGLLPRREGLVFTGCVHETPLPSAERLGLPVETLAVPVHHYGYVQGAGRNAARARRDAGLVRRKHVAHPSATGTRLELAVVLLEEGAIAEAEALLAALADHAPADSAVTRGRYLLARLRSEQGRLDEATGLLRRAVADDPRHFHCWLAWIRAEAARAAWPTCVEILARARARFGDDPLLDREELRVLVKTGRLEAAAALVERLRQNQPQWHDLAGLAARLRRLTDRRDPID